MNKIISILVILVFPCGIFAQEGLKSIPDPGSVKARASEAAARTVSIMSDFTQEKEMSFMQEKVVSGGKFYFQKENQLRWEYTSPYSYVILVNGSRISIIDEGRRKDYDGSSNRMFLEISEIMSGLVNGSLLAGDRFAQEWQEGPGFYLVHLTPLSTVMKDYVSKIILKLDPEDFSAVELKMEEKTGDYTLITFYNRKINATLPVGIFDVD
jgi:outer membrane lipoprotein-sorting protein